MTHTPGSGPTTRAGGPRRQAWSTPKTIFPPSTYGGDFETTAIPRYDSGKSAPCAPASACSATPSRCRTCSRRRSALRRRSAPNPPRSSRIAATTGRVAVGRRGTQDLGLLLLRVARRRAAHRARPAEGVRLVGRPRPGRLRGLADRAGLPARRHPDLRRGRRPDRRRACCWCSACSPRWPPPARWPIWSPACWRRRWPRTRRPGSSSFLTDGHEYQVILIVRASRRSS